MVEPREIRYPIILSTAELSYLLVLVEAPTLIGANNQALFPADEAAREAQWLRGRERLEIDRWLIWDPVEGHHKINDQLMLIIATLADPKMVVLTGLRAADRQRYGVNHYLSLDLVIEMAHHDEHYELLVLVSTMTMVGRLAATLGLPAAKDAELSFELSRAEVEQAKHRPDPAWLESRGLSQEAAHLFAATVQQPQQSGSLTLLRTEAAQPVEMLLLGFLVGANNVAWLGTPRANERVFYQLADKGDFEAMLSSLIAELRSPPLQSYASPGGS